MSCRVGFFDLDFIRNYGEFREMIRIFNEGKGDISRKFVLLKGVMFNL